MVFGSIGMGFLYYGKRQSAPIPLICGVLLTALPWFVSNAWAMVLIGVALMAIPRFLRF